MTEELTADRVLQEIESALRQPENDDASSLETRIAQVRDMLERFRREPIGGRLLWPKRVLYWFSASAFDRQTRILEAMLGLVEELSLEVRREARGQQGD